MSATLAPITLTLTLPLPGLELSLNGRGGGWHRLHQGQAQQQRLAGLLAAQLTPDTRPCFPRATLLRMAIDVERRKRGQVRDTAGIIEAIKGYCDGLEGIVYADDQQIREYRIRWDTKPTGRGLVHLYIAPLDADPTWPEVAWETEAIP